MVILVAIPGSGDEHQMALYGALLLLLVQAMAPPASVGAADPQVRTAAYQVFKAGLQSSRLAPLLPEALKALSVDEKTRLREGVKAAEAANGTGALQSGRVTQSPSKPAINFAAFGR